MKTAIMCATVLFMAMAGSFAHALEPFALYDNFSSKFIDEAKWYGPESTTPGVVILEVVRQISKGQLHMLSRAYGNMSSNTGASLGRTGLGFAFADPDTITAMKATVQVISVEADGCSDNSTPTKTFVALLGTFFNTGIPTPGSFLNDVIAYIAIELASNSTDKPGTLEVAGYVVQCDNSICLPGTILQHQTLGTIKVLKSCTFLG